MSGVIGLYPILGRGQWDAWLDVQPVAVATDSMVAFVGDMLANGQPIIGQQWKWFWEHVEDLGGSRP